MAESLPLIARGGSVTCQWEKYQTRGQKAAGRGAGGKVAKGTLFLFDSQPRLCMFSPANQEATSHMALETAHKVPSSVRPPSAPEACPAADTPTTQTTSQPPRLNCLVALLTLSNSCSRCVCICIQICITYSPVYNQQRRPWHKLGEL